ncbi:MAG: TlyA family RNA methyltransferase [Clostridiales Family XIII bacterium]|jgi:23S rRNA (cytidine1920-2'-O)/16S rRNA (cytidine1409-2'-O)-methyltransferase|nr:TlyA family RNA methyltransferase [Clostridiales Family XIII bacterium]
MKVKSRLDIFLFKHKYFSSYERAKAEILAGNVFVDGMKQDKPGYQISEEKLSTPIIKIKEKSLKYVSRGGLKLEKAAEVWAINFKDRTVVDIGASTGGFTDFAIKKGAKKVYAIDVGYGQLDYSLRINEKVINMERTNIRYLFNDKETGASKNENLLTCADLIVIDLSFISLKLALPIAIKLLKDDGEIISLIKPQFEAKKGEVEKGGIIRDKNIHRRVIEKVKNFVEENNLTFDGIIESPIKGVKGNKEFLMKNQKKVQNA